MSEQSEREAYNEAAREDYEGREREEMDRPLFTQREVDAAVQAEREACARIADQMPCSDTGTFGDGFSAACNEIECAIRSRGPSPAVDVMKVAREYVEAECALERPHAPEDREELVCEAARKYLALVALVAPRTAEEPSGVEDVAKRLMGFRLVPDASIPPGEIHANVDGHTAGKIVGMDAPATPVAREGRS